LRVHVHFLDPYRSLDSPIHALDARVKFGLSIAFIITCSLTPVAAWPAYMLLFSVILSVEILSGLGIRYVMKRAALALPFALAAFPVIFSSPGHALFTLPLGSWSLTASVEGSERFISVVVKSWLSVQAAIVLAASTPFPDLLQAMRSASIPKLLVAMFGLMWRYLFVLVDEALRLMRARTARSGHAADSSLTPGGSVAWRAKVTGGMAGSLLLRAFERSERIYVAMLSRGYDGETRTLPSPPIRRADWAILISGIAALLFLLLVGFLFGR
jgi:cobalt/nickel transport system permease protein